MRSNIHIQYYWRAVQEMGLPGERILKGSAVRFMSPSGMPHFIVKAATCLNTVASAHLSKNKVKTLEILKESGIPTPTQQLVTTLEEAQQFLGMYQAIVVKPVKEKGGNGVTVLPSEKQLPLAVATAQKYGKSVIVETFIAGTNYRLLILDDQVLAVTRRLPPFVVGDGVHTVKELIEVKSALQRERKIPAIPMDHITSTVLDSQGYALDGVPHQGATVFARLTANLSLGGTTEDVTDIAHPDYGKLGIACAKALGLRLAGLDLITPDITDISVPHAIIEANTNPGLRIHYTDILGEKRHVAASIVKKIWEMVQVDR